MIVRRSRLYICDLKTIMSTFNFDYYRRRAHAKKAGLSKFLKKVVRKKPRGLLKDVKQASDQAWETVNCTNCGACCKEMTPTWKKSEVKRMAAHMGMTYKEYYDKYLYTDDEGCIMNNSTPCQHLSLKTGLCSVYELRPHDCSEFPHFHRKDFTDQVKEVFIPNMPRCPATLIMVERLEAIMKEKEF